MERRNGRQGHLTGRGAYKQWSGDTKIFPVSPKIFVPGHEDGLHLAVLLRLEVALLAGDVLQQLPGLGPAGLHTTLGWMGRDTASCAAGVWEDSLRCQQQNFVVIFTIFGETLLKMTTGTFTLKNLNFRDTLLPIS